MKEVVEKVHVPAHDVETKFYESFDGNKFRDPESCANYEKHKRLEELLRAHPLFKSKRETYIWPEEDFAYLYYLSSKGDHDLLVEQNKLEEYIQDDYDTFGPGFYLLVTNSNNSDFRTEYKLLHVNYYIRCLETELDVWKAELSALKHSIQSENEEAVEDE